MKVNKAFISSDGKLALMIDSSVVMVDDNVTQSLKELLTERYYLSREEKAQRIKEGLARSGFKPTGKKADARKHERIKELLSTKSLTKDEIAATVGCGVATVYRVAAEWSKDMQRIGIDKAKADGKYKGRKPKLSDDDVEALLERIKSGESKTKVANDMGITRATLYSYLNEE